MFGTPKMASAAQIIAMARDAEDNARNRQADTERLVRDLDPDGVNICSLVLAFHNDQMEHRITVYAKILGSSSPVKFTLDVDTDLWDVLPDVPRETLEQARSK